MTSVIVQLSIMIRGVCQGRDYILVSKMIKDQFTVGVDFKPTNGSHHPVLAYLCN